MSNTYDDILHLPRPVSGHRPRMPMSNRAAQFSPFSALTGYGEAIDETIRHTTDQCLLSEDAIADINRQLLALQERVKEKPLIRVTHFVPDAKKVGGQYVETILQLKKVDTYQGQLVGSNGEVIPFDALVYICREREDLLQ